jgi:hypothetical protein
MVPAQDFHPFDFTTSQRMCQALEKKEEEDLCQDLRQALMKRARGYDVDEVEKIVGGDGVVVRATVRRRHIPPDVKAIERIQYLQATGRWE